MHDTSELPQSSVLSSPPAGWYSKFPEATIADAILDRIVHDSYTIEIRGADEHSQKSMREVYGVGSK